MGTYQGGRAGASIVTSNRIYLPRSDERNYDWEDWIDKIMRGNGSVLVVYSDLSSTFGSLPSRVVCYQVYRYFCKSSSALCLQEQLRELSWFFGSLPSRVVCYRVYEYLCKSSAWSGSLDLCHVVLCLFWRTAWGNSWTRKHLSLCDDEFQFSVLLLCFLCTAQKASVNNQPAASSRVAREERRELSPPEPWLIRCPRSMLRK